MLIDNLVIDLNQKNCKLWLCKPDLNKTVISRLWEADNQIKLNLKFGNVSELQFKVPYFIEKDHVMISNTNIALIKDRYIIKLVWGDYIEYFTIRIPSDNMNEDSDLKSFTCFSLQYELNDKSLKDYNVTSYNANDALVGNGTDKTGILSNTLWTTDYIDPDFNSMYRTINISSATVLEGVFQIATTFSAIVIWNTSTRTISLYKQENIGLDRGLKFSYGHYLKTLQQDINSDDVCTRLKVYGKSNLTIQEYNATGANYIEDYSYFLYPFQRDVSKVVLQSSNYMSDSLCNALLDYQALIAAKEPITKISETGTTTTNIKITAHGLVVGDYIVNTTRANTVQQVITVVDVNNITVASITGQTIGDSIDLYKDGTFGKLLYQLNDQQALLTTKQNELTTLTTDMNVIQDNLSIALSTNATYGAITTYSIGNTVVYNSVPYRCILASTGNLPTNTTYWENLVTSKTNKQIAIDAKNAEITTVNSAITSLNSQVTTLRNGIKIESSLTLAQLQELNQFIIEKEVINDYIDDAKQLLLWAKKEFTKINTPPINLKIGVVDLFKTFDKSAQIDRDKIVLAETVTVQNDRLNINTKAKIIEINIDFESYDALTVTIANVQQILTDQQKFIKMLNQAISTSTQVDLAKLKWDLAADKADLVTQQLNAAYDATKQSILAGVNNTVELSRKGLVIKDSTDPLSYLVANNSTLAITNDNGNSWKNAITKNGIIGDRIIGQILMSNVLKMTNANADFTFDQNGVVLKNTGITITGGLPSAQMDSTFVNQVNTATTNASTALTSATAANTEIANMASDDKISPVEKIGLKKDWDAIVAEKSPLDTQATTYSITTEKTTYDNAYDALNSYLIANSASGNYTLLSDKAVIVSLGFTAISINITSPGHTIVFPYLGDITKYTKDGVVKTFAIEGGYVNSTGFKFWTDWAVGAVANWTATSSGVDVFANMTTTTDLGVGGGVTLRNNFSSYYTAKVNLLNKVSNILNTQPNLLKNGGAEIYTGTSGVNIPDGWSVLHPTVWSDLFDINSIAQYTSGGDVTATWAISGGVLSGTGGTQATLIKNSLTLSDCEIEVTSDQAQDAGIIARYQDNNNYYLMSLLDDTSVPSGNNIILWKKISGVYTNIGSAANLTWSRGTSKKIKFTLQGSLLEVWFDGVKVISVTDTVFSSGSVGLRNNSSTASHFLDINIRQYNIVGFTRRVNDTIYTIKGNASFEIFTTDTTVNSYGRYYQAIAVSPGEIYTMSALITTLRCIGKLRFEYTNADGTISYGALDGTGLNNIATPTPAILTATIPTSCTRLVCILDKGITTAGQTSSYLFADNVKLEKGSIATAYVETDLAVAENVNNSVQQGTAYNSVVINSTDGVKVTHTDGSYTQMSGNGFERYVSGVSNKYHYLSTAGPGATITRQNVSLGDLAPLPVTITLPTTFKGKDFQVAPSIKSWTIVAGVLYDIYLEVTAKDITNGTFTVGAYAHYDFSGSPRWAGINFSYVAIA